MRRRWLELMLVSLLGRGMVLVPLWLEGAQAMATVRLSLVGAQATVLPLMLLLLLRLLLRLLLVVLLLLMVRVLLVMVPLLLVLVPLLLVMVPLLLVMVLLLNLVRGMGTVPDSVQAMAPATVAGPEPELAAAPRGLCAAASSWLDGRVDSERMYLCNSPLAMRPLTA